MQAVSAMLDLFGRVSGISAAPVAEIPQPTLAATSPQRSAAVLSPDIVEVYEHESQEGVVVRIPQDAVELHISHDRAESVLRAVADYYGYELRAR